MARQVDPAREVEEVWQLQAGRKLKRGGREAPQLKYKDNNFIS